MLAAWLRSAALFGSHEEHLAAANSMTAEDRADCRAELLEEPEGAELAAQERPRREGEGDEPEGLA